jgi:hypothetical protein
MLNVMMALSVWIKVFSSIMCSPLEVLFLQTLTAICPQKNSIAYVRLAMKLAAVLNTGLPRQPTQHTYSYVSLQFSISYSHLTGVELKKLPLGGRLGGPVERRSHGFDMRPSYQYVALEFAGSNDPQKTEKSF